MTRMFSLVRWSGRLSEKGKSEQRLEWSEDRLVQASTTSRTKTDQGLPWQV